MTSDEDGIGGCDGIAAYGTEITDVDVDAWGPEPAGVLIDDSLALRTDFEGFDVQMGELQTSLYLDTACTEADVPKHTLFRQVKCL